ALRWIHLAPLGSARLGSPGTREHAANQSGSRRPAKRKGLGGIARESRRGPYEPSQETSGGKEMSRHDKLRLLRVMAVLLVPMGLEAAASAAENALLKASRLNDLSAAKAALDKNPKEIDSRDENECTPLHEAARYCDAQ